MIIRNTLLALVVSALPLVAYGQGADAAIISYKERHQPVLGLDGMVAAQNRQSAAVGAEILAAGGNAVDAAVATGFSLAVTLPRAGNLGGGGFMLIHDAESGEDVAIDYREQAPKGATYDMFLDEYGNVDAARARYSHLSAGVPGTVAGLYLAHRKYGRLPWRQLLQPAIRQAREGIVVNFDLSLLLKVRQKRLCMDDAACAYFYKAGGLAYEPGELLLQEDLATTLEQIAEDGPDAFYKGAIAEKIVAEMERGGGLIDAVSLAAYEPTVREVIRGSYRGFEIVTMPPPSSGGVHLVQMLNALEHFQVAEMGAGSVDSLHLLAEVSRQAYADRSKHLGDPDFYDVPVEWLTSKSYGDEIAAAIDMEKARRSEDLAPGAPVPYESEDTTHFSVIDDDGNVVSNTYTLNFSYGSGIAVAGAGFLLNNEMDDFSAKPGAPNGYGLLGGAANAIDADKRPLSSMTPTIVFADGEPWFATGSPGGSRIITTVLQMIVNVIDHGMNIAAATAAPRAHHQWYPDLLRLESGFSPDTIRLLRERGHTVDDTGNAMGSLQTVGIVGNTFIGASDTRRPNAGSVAPVIAVEE